MQWRGAALCQTRFKMRISITYLVELKTGTIISIDGKAVKSARDKINGGNTPYILSAFLSEIGISIGQVAVDKKSNEIKAIPDLLKILDIRGCYLTIDAMGTQETIARGIVKAGGHYTNPRLKSYLPIG